MSAPPNVDYEPPPRPRWPLQRILLGLAIAAVGAASVTAVFAQRADDWNVDRTGPTSGGGESTGGGYALYGVIGQAIVGHSSSQGHGLESGLLGGGAEKYHRVLPFITRDGTW
jgi:hypothetical protein